MGGVWLELLTVTLPVLCTVAAGAAVSLRRMGGLEQLARDQGEELREVHRQVDAHTGNYLVHRVGR